MKFATLLILASATLLPAQGQKPKPAAKPAPASTSPAAPATLADLRRDCDQQKLAALDAYLKRHAAAADADEALVEAAQLAKTLGQPDQVVRYTDQYQQQFADGGDATEMRLLRAGALRQKGDLAGAQKAYEAIIDGGGDLQQVVSAATTLGELLVAQGKKDEAKELLNVVGSAHKDARGLKEYLDGIVANYELIGTEPKPLGKNDTAGKPLDYADYKGKVLLLDFWATWCGPCVAELPNVLAAYQKYHDKGFEIIGISLDREQDRAKFDKFIADRGMTWRHYFDGKFWQNDIAVAWGVQSIPATYLIGPDGKIAAVGLRGEQLGEKLAELLGSKK